MQRLLSNFRSFFNKAVLNDSTNKPQKSVAEIDPVPASSKWQDDVEVPTDDAWLNLITPNALPGLAFSHFSALGAWHFYPRRKVKSIRIATDKRSRSLKLHKIDFWRKDSNGNFKAISKGFSCQGLKRTKKSVSAAAIVNRAMKYSNYFDAAPMGDEEQSKKRSWQIDFDTPTYIERVDLYNSMNRQASTITALTVSYLDEKGDIIGADCRSKADFQQRFINESVIPALNQIYAGLYCLDSEQAAQKFMATIADYFKDPKTSVEPFQQYLVGLADQHIGNTFDYGTTANEGIEISVAPGVRKVTVDALTTKNSKLVAAFDTTPERRLPGHRVGAGLIQNERYQITKAIPSAINITQYEIVFEPSNVERTLCIFCPEDGGARILTREIYASTDAKKKGVLVADTVQNYQFVNDLRRLIEWVGGATLDHYQVEVAAMICAVYRRNTLRRLKRFMTNADQVQVAVDTVEKYGDRVSFMPPVIFTRHGVKAPFATQDSDNLAAHMLDFSNWLEQEFGLQAFPMFGTLLGIHRENRFLPHDDDIDMAVVVDLPEGMTPRQGAVAWSKKIESHGFNCKFPRKFSTNMHVDYKHKALDLFIIFRNYPKAGRAFTHMEKYALRDLPLSQLEPISTLSFKSATYYAPNDIEGFLEERYGKGWIKPDPTFEM